MINLVPAKCPSCGAQLELDDNLKRTECKYCKTTIIVDEAIQKYQIEISGEVKVDGIIGKKDLLEDAKTLAKIGKFAEASKKFLKYIDKYPGDYEGYYNYLNLLLNDEFIEEGLVELSDLMCFEDSAYKPFIKLAPKEKIEEIDQKYEDLYTKYKDDIKYIDLKDIREKEDRIIDNWNLEYEKRVSKFYKKLYQAESPKISLLNEYYYLDVLESFNAQNILVFSIQNSAYCYQKFIFDNKNYCFYIKDKKPSKEESALCKKNLFGKIEPKTLFGVETLTEKFNLVGIDLNGNPIYAARSDKYRYFTFTLEDINLNDYTLEEIKAKMSSCEKLEVAQKRAEYLNKLGIKEAEKFLNIEIGYNKKGYESKFFSGFKYIFKDGKIIFNGEGLNEGSTQDRIIILPNTSAIEKIVLK